MGCWSESPSQEIEVRCDVLGSCTPQIHAHLRSNDRVVEVAHQVGGYSHRQATVPTYEWHVGLVLVIDQCR